VHFSTKKTKKGGTLAIFFLPFRNFLFQNEISGRFKNCKLKKHSDNEQKSALQISRNLASNWIFESTLPKKDIKLKVQTIESPC